MDHRDVRCHPGMQEVQPQVGRGMKLSEIIESLTYIKTNNGDVEVTKVGWFEGDNGCQVYVNYE